MSRRLNKDSPLTSLQEQVLGTLVDGVRHGIADAGEISRNLLINTSSARGALIALEHRGLVEPVYTGHQFHGRAYQASDDGHEVYQRVFGGDEDAND